LLDLPRDPLHGFPVVSWHLGMNLPYVNDHSSDGT
jgi:hypothetical protein